LIKFNRQEDAIDTPRKYKIILVSSITVASGMLSLGIYFICRFRRNSNGKAIFLFSNSKIGLIVHCTGFVEAENV